MRTPLVAVVDSGWDRRQARPAVLPGAAFIGEDPDDDHDRLGHGTACIRRLLKGAPGARVLPARVFGATDEAEPEAVAAAIGWAAASGVDVIALSLGTRRVDALPRLEEACLAASRAGALIIAAGPNAGPPTWPASFPFVVGVWADSELPPGGLRLRSAPTLDLDSGVDPAEGTSLATAAIAGRLALEWERGGSAADLLRRLVPSTAVRPWTGARRGI